MHTHRKYLIALTSVLAMVLSVPGAVWAGGGRSNDNHGHNVNKSGNKATAHSTPNYTNRKDGHYAAKEPYHGHYYHGRYYPYYYYPCKKNCGNNSHHNNNNNDNGKLWGGLIGGGLLGYGLGTLTHSNSGEQTK